jgi:hypothetical protein
MSHLLRVARPIRARQLVEHLLLTVGEIGEMLEKSGGVLGEIVARVAAT